MTQGTKDARKTIRVVIAEDQGMVLGALAKLLEFENDISVVAKARDGNEALKKMEKDHKLSQDEHHKWSDEVQALTDGHVKKIDEALQTKEKEILQV